MENDPGYLARRNEMQDRVKEIENESKILETPFIEDLHVHGYTSIQSSSDLTKLKKADPTLVELLLKWIPRIDNKHRSQEMLVRGLAVATAPFNAAALTHLFDNSQAFSLKWAIANTIAGNDLLNVTSWLEKKLNDEVPDKTWEMLMYAVARYFPYDRSSEMLRRLFHQFPLQVADAFSMIGRTADITYLEDMSLKYKGAQRTSINKSIKKLQQRLGKGK